MAEITRNDIPDGFGFPTEEALKMAASRKRRSSERSNAPAKKKGR